MPPFIAALLGSGLRLVANAALVKGKQFIEEKTGVNLDQATLSPDDQLKLQQFQLEHEEELLKLQLDDNKLSLEETKAYLADAQSARDREVKLATADNVPTYIKATPTILAWGVVGLTFALFTFFVIVSGDDPSKIGADGKPVQYINQSQRDIIVYILGVLSAAVTQVLGYYFGSSEGSAKKSEQIGQALQQQQQQQQPR